MKNKEYYKEELLSVLAEVLGIEKATGKPFLCNGFGVCSKCLFEDNRLCYSKAKQWLEQEYIEPIKLTYFEKVILENIDNRAKWLGRDRYGDIYAYDVKPCKDGMLWENRSTEFDLNIFKHLFNFVKWEDEEPCNIQELLEKCEIE